MRITSKGQVTIPQEIREKLGLLPSTDVEFEIEGNAVRIRKRRQSQARGRLIVDHLRGRATANRHLSTNELMALLRSDDR